MSQGTQKYRKFLNEYIHMQPKKLYTTVYNITNIFQKTSLGDHLIVNYS